MPEDKAGAQIRGNLYRGATGQFQAGPAGQLRARLAAVRGKRGRAKPAKPAKPDVGATLGKLGVSAADQAALLALAAGDAPENADALIAMGLAVVDTTGQVRMTSQGRQLMRAAQSGNAGLARDILSESRDSVAAREKEQEAQGQKEQEREQKRQARDAERKQKQQEREQKREERGSGKGGSGGGGKNDAERERKEQEREQKREERKQEREAERKRKEQERKKPAIDKATLQALMDALASALGGVSTKQVQGAAMQNDDTTTKAYEVIYDALIQCGDGLAEAGDGVKAGRRNSAADAALIQEIYESAHDICELAMALGAEDAGAGDAPILDDEAMEEAPPAVKADAEADTPWRLGDAVKALGGDVIGGYAVRFGSPREPDLSPMRDYFTKATDFWIDAWSERPMLYHHALEPETADDPRIGIWTKATITDEGVWLEGELNKAYRYYKAIKEMVNRGVLRLSSDSAPHLIRREPDIEHTHKVVRWPLIATSVTPTPAEPRLGSVLSLKALTAWCEGPEADAGDDGERSETTKAVDSERLQRLSLELDLLTLEE